MVTASSAGTRNMKFLVFGIAALAILVAAGVGGLSWWKNHNEPSQASAADCALAQQIIDQAQKLPKDKAADEKWLKDTQQLGSAQMKDGYLRLQISRYEDWAADNAEGRASAPTREELADMKDKANSHCTAANRTLVVPPIGS